MSDLVFIGPSGAGKSRLGKRVAKILDIPFADTDKMVVAEYGPIAGIFSEHGEARFRELERAAVVRGLRGAGVLSLGGGAVLNAATRSDLADQRVVFLTVSPEAVEARLGDKRPLVANGIADWVTLNENRWPLYESLADATFDTSVGPDADLAEEVARWAQQTA